MRSIVRAYLTSVAAVSGVRRRVTSTLCEASSGATMSVYLARLRPPPPYGLTYQQHTLDVDCVRRARCRTVV